MAVAAAKAVANKSARRTRRTQAERSEAMRKRLIAATLESLAEDGYAGSTLSSIVRRAGVSRGAQVHHYPSKDALILDAADYLMRRAYRVLGDVLLGIADERNRLEALLDTTWAEIFDTRMFRAFFELMVASQRDEGLAQALRELSARTAQTLRTPVAHYFEKAADDAEEPFDMFVLTTFVLGGMTASAQLADPKVIRSSLAVWTRLMAGQMRARKGVRTPPPRPETWTRPDSK